MLIHGWELSGWPGRMGQGFINIEEAALIAAPASKPKPSTMRTALRDAFRDRCCNTP